MLPKKQGLEVWLEKILNRREELKRMIKDVYSDACLFEEKQKTYYIDIRYDSNVFLDMRLADELLGHGLAYPVYKVGCFDCTNGGDFNYSDYLSPEENYLFDVWCKVGLCERSWSELKEWNSDVYNRVGIEHRLATIEKFNPDEALNQSIKELEDLIEEETTKLNSQTDDPLQPQPEPYKIPESCLKLFWELFEKHGVSWYSYLPCNLCKWEFFVEFSLALTMLENFLHCHEPVPDKYKELVVKWLERDSVTDKNMIRRVLLDGFTYSDLFVLLWFPLQYHYHVETDCKRIHNGPFSDNIILEKYHPEHGYAFGPLPEVPF